MKRYKIGDTDLDPIEQKIVVDTTQYGWHVLGVLPSANTWEYAYSIGVYQSYAHPEIAIFGIPFHEAHSIINELVSAVKEGEPFDHGRAYPELLEGASCWFAPANPAWFEACFGRAIDFYGTLDFPMLQCVWSDPAGHFPWEPQFDPNLIGLQPNLATDPAS